METKNREQMYKLLFEQHPDLIFSLDFSGQITSVNQALSKALGYGIDEVIHTNIINYIACEYKNDVELLIKETFDGKSGQSPAKMIHKSGETFDFCLITIPIIIDENVIGIYFISKNITRQREYEKKITQLACYDPLTGLPNRISFEKRLSKAIEKAMGSKEKLAVIFIDIDQFKWINESLGHQIGDQILQFLSNRLLEGIGGRGTLCRFTGDEFTLIVENVSDIQEISELVTNFTKSLKTPYLFNGQEFLMTASIGISMYPEDGATVETLIKNADIALHRAKQRGRDGLEFYEGEMNDFIVKRIEMERDLRKAIPKNELELFYQPQVFLDDGSLIAFEALVRWNHPKLGLVSPAQFIPLAEETGLIEPIGKWVLYTACNQLKKWNKLGVTNISISVNVSGRQFQNREFVYQVRDAILRTGIEPQYLHLELTESIMIENVQYSLAIMKELKLLGVKLSVDDFGTGYSSLSYLKDFPIDILKIDRSFIRNLSSASFDSSDASIVQAIITMCKGLSVIPLAEGIEKEDQMNLLRQYGCELAQGYLISKPVPSREAELLFPIAK